MLGDVSFTCLQYGGDSVLYVGTNTGVLSAWDTRHNSCFMHWDADSAEIGKSEVKLFNPYSYVFQTVYPI